jgi:phage terminase large subunit
VVSATLPHLKRGAIRDFNDILLRSGLYSDSSWNKTSLTYSIGNSLIEFFSVDQPEKVYGASRDILFINEANHIDEERARQLIIRTRGTIFFDFNPTSQFYVHTDYLLRPEAYYIHSTYKDNPYLEEAIVHELLEAGKRNENFRKVFVEGEIGSIEGVVFENWEIGEFDNSLQVVYGQDYGFVNDPTTLVRIAIDKKRKKLYICECYYLKGLTTSQIYELNKMHAGQNLIVADSAEPRLIEELRARGNNIVAAKKGQGSVSEGLLSMLDYKIVVTDNSHNLMNELRNYIWLDGRSKIVIDAYNHCIDAARYAFTHLNSNNFVIA